ncbi:ciliary microtubule inner protein 2C [Misgurnus anguillicaudatus]|uniref:ciliary microtubule inner protein 2C n=1 Tax=Misgurnus anguillicaudatus TaxID=75329 RepID=UPI00243585EA|nr:protein FAM166C A [Misgurnus anguillicaudatus]
MDLRGTGAFITHNNTAYIPPSLMPGYCGHVPTTKYIYGETFGNSTLKYFQNSRSAIMASSKTHYNTGDVPVTTLRSHTHTQSSIMPYWVRYNIDFKRQKEIKDFNMLSQKHRENYKDKTGTVQSVNYFVVPVNEMDSSPSKSIDYVGSE